MHLRTLILAKRAELKSLPCDRVPRQLEKKIREWVRFQFTEEQQEEKVCKKYPCLQQFVLRFRPTWRQMNHLCIASFCGFNCSLSSALWLCALLLSAIFSHLELGRSVAYSRTWRCLRNSSWRWPKACSTASFLRFKHVVSILLIGNLYSWFHCKYMRIGRGPRYMICVTLLAHCASQKIHGHARIETRARLACPCVFWLAQRAKSCDKIWYLRPLPTYEHVLIFFLNLSIAASFPGQSCRAGASRLCSGGKKNKESYNTTSYLLYVHVIVNIRKLVE